MGKQWKQCQTLFLGAPKSLQMVIAAMSYSEEKTAHTNGVRVRVRTGGYQILINSPVHSLAWVLPWLHSAKVAWMVEEEQHWIAFYGHSKLYYKERNSGMPGTFCLPKSQLCRNGIPS